MKPTKEQLKDPQWWKDNVDDKHDYAYTTGPRWDGSTAFKGCIDFGDSAGRKSGIVKMTLNEESWVLLCERPEWFVPEIGAWCECDYPSKWTKVFVIGPNSESSTVIELQCGETISVGSIIEFRPLKTERESFIDWACNVMNNSVDDSQEGWATALYDNGARAEGE